MEGDGVLPEMLLAKGLERQQKLLRMIVGGEQEAEVERLPTLVRPRLGSRSTAKAAEELRTKRQKRRERTVRKLKELQQHPEDQQRKATLCSEAVIREWAHGAAQHPRDDPRRDSQFEEQLRRARGKPESPKGELPRISSTVGPQEDRPRRPSEDGLGTWRVLFGLYTYCEPSYEAPHCAVLKRGELVRAIETVSNRDGEVVWVCCDRGWIPCAHKKLRNMAYVQKYENPVVENVNQMMLQGLDSITGRVCGALQKLRAVTLPSSDEGSQYADMTVEEMRDSLYSSKRALRLARPRFAEIKMVLTDSPPSTFLPAIAPPSPTSPT